MSFQLPKLPYEKDALEPHISRETLEYHYGKHHQAYVNKLNDLVRDRPEEKKSLEEIIRSSSGAVLNNAAQAWNHAFYWNCLAPAAGGAPQGGLAEAIEKNFQGFADFKQKFSEAAAGLFGSGWAWLVKTQDGSLAVVQTQNALNPITQGEVPLLVCDVWEHAYYIDYRNARPKYVEAFWNLVNWRFAEDQFRQAST